MATVADPPRPPRAAPVIPRLGPAALAFALTALAAVVALPLQDHRIAVFWPAAGVIAGLLLARPRARVAVLAGALAALAIGNVLSGRTLPAALVFMAGNLVQALAFALAMEALVGRPVRLDSLRSVSAFVGVAAAVPALVGLAAAAGLLGVSYVTGSFHEVWFIWFASHAVGIIAVAPAIIATFTSPSLWSGSRKEHRIGAATLAVFAAGAAALVALTPPDNDVALIAVFALLYPFALWVAGRTSPAWCSLALLALATVVIVATSAGHGLFAGRIGAAQLFLLVAALWLLTLGLVLENLRRSRDQALASEAALRDSLAVGRAFTFAWTPADDRAERQGQQPILAEPSVVTSASHFASVHPDDRAAFLTLVRALSPSNPEYTVTYRYRSAHAGNVWLQERGRGEFDDAGALVRLRGVVVDVTSRREAEIALQASDRRKDEFIATLAHELRNPLAPIRTGLEILARARHDEALGGEALSLIRRQVDHLVRLVDDLLDLSRVATGKLALRVECLDLAAVVRHAIEDVAPQVRARDHRLEIDGVDEPLPVKGDRARLTQVVTNLLTNAARYTDPGGRIAVSLSVEAGEAVLRVADSGIGIPADKLDTIFELFSQVHGPRGYGGEGLGIGLNLAKRIVEVHGGTISARSAGPMQGSEFAVRLPAVAPEAAAPSRPAGSIPVA